MKYLAIKVVIVIFVSSIACPATLVSLISILRYKTRYFAFESLSTTILIYLNPSISFKRVRIKVLIFFIAT